MKHPESKTQPKPASEKPSPKNYKKENVGEAIAGPEGFPSNSQPEAYFRRVLEPALKSAVAEDRHELVLALTHQADEAAVFGYLRGSTDDQEGSIYSQAEELLYACQREGYRLTRIFWDLESGTKGEGDRPGLKALKAAAKQVKGDPTRRVQGVVVWHMNRFSRRIRIGLLDLWELSDDGCPVIFPRRRGRLQTANMDDTNDVVDAVNALADAEDDLSEHTAKIRRGSRTLLRQGIHPTAKGEWMFWALEVTDQKAKSGNYHRKVVRRAEPVVPYANVAGMLLAFPEFSTAQAVAKVMGRRTTPFLEELQLPWAVGDFRFGVFLDDPEMRRNPQPIGITDDATFEQLSMTAKELQEGGRKPRRTVRSRETLGKRSPEYWLLKREDLVILCHAKLGKRRNGLPKRCTAVMRLRVADSTIHPGKDLLECHHGHTRVWPPSDVMQEVACDQPPFCAKCGTNDHVAVSIRDSRATCTKFECRRCGLRMQAFGNFLPRPGQQNKPNPEARHQTRLT